MLKGSRSLIAHKSKLTIHRDGNRTAHHEVDWRDVGYLTTEYWRIFGQLERVTVGIRENTNSCWLLASCKTKVQEAKNQELDSMHNKIEQHLEGTTEKEFWQVIKNLRKNQKVEFKLVW